MRHFPVFLDVQGRRALVVGEGENAHRKASALRRAGAEVVCAALFEPGLLDGVCIAIGADAPDENLQALSTAAQACGIPVNVVDRPALCSFLSPAVVDRDPLTIAIGSGGAAPVLARLLRARIEAVVPPAFGALAALAGRFKDEARRLLPDTAHRRRALEEALGGRAADLMLAGHAAAAEDAFRDALHGAGPKRGIVYLVGAGPGAADLLTLRAHRLLGEADVIVYDRLVSPEVLDMARRDAERIFVGKSRAQHCLPQEGINALLVRLGQEGRKVVRLKGGDPFVFGRGGEEALALTEAGVPCEVVPGITAALACAAQAGIPLTHRAVARTLTLVTGHTQDGKLDVDFAQLVRGGTVAVYMGLVTLPGMRDGLLAAGLPHGTPAALVESGGTPRQRELYGTLDTLVAGAGAWAGGGPVLLLVGDAVGLRAVASVPEETGEAKAVMHA